MLRKLVAQRLSARQGSVWQTQIDKNSDIFKANEIALRADVEKLKSRCAEVSLGGGERYRNLHTSRGKLLPRDRIQRLIDPQSPFLELSQLAAYDLYGDENVPAAGIITGIGRVNGIIFEKCCE